MLIRCAFFRGTVKPGRELEFSEYVRDRLLPLWSKFPGAEQVQVLRQLESDVTDPHLAMVLSIRYPDAAAIERAMASDARYESREVTKGLVELFDGSIFHTVFDVAHDVSLARS